MRRPYLLIPLAMATAAPAAVPSAEPDSQAQSCFWASQVTGFGDAGPDRALLHIGARQTWALTLSPGCPDVNWAMNIAIASRTGERICTGRPAELIVPDASGSGSQRCRVRSVRKLSAAEAAAARGQTPRP